MSNISRSLLLTIIFFLGLILSCASHNSRTRPRAIEDKRTAGEARFNPLGDPGDEDVITSNVPISADSIDESGNFSLQPQSNSADTKTVPIFAVQVFASKSSTEARDFKQTTAPSFSEEIKIDYQAPYYKVIIGRAEGLDNAQILLKKVKDQGFPEAWLVRLR